FTILPPHPTCPLLPYTTLFRSHSRKIVTSQVYEHHMFGNLFGIIPKLCFQRLIFFIGITAGTRSRNRQQLCYLLLHAHQNLRRGDRKSTRLNSSHVSISYAVFC